MILIAGGTGRLGGELVGLLTAEGRDVRVLTRDPARAAHLSGVEVVVGDVRRPADLGPAMAQVETVVSAIHGFMAWGRGPAAVDRDGNAHLVDAAATVGAHVVLMSGLDVASTHPMDLFRMKAAAEQQLRAADVPWTIVRAGAFLELYEELIRRTTGRSGRPLIFGRGDNPIVFSRVAEVAAAVHRAISDPDCRGRIIEVPGPTMTMNELAAGVTARQGAVGPAPRHVPRPVLRLLAAAHGTPLGRQAASALVMDSLDMTHPIRTQDEASPRSRR
jgi:NADH dehydrogenase